MCCTNIYHIDRRIRVSRAISAQEMCLPVWHTLMVRKHEKLQVLSTILVNLLKKSRFSTKSSVYLHQKGNIPNKKNKESTVIKFADLANNFHQAKTVKNLMFIYEQIGECDTNAAPIKVFQMTGEHILVCCFLISKALINLWGS